MSNYRNNNNVNGYNSCSDTDEETNHDSNSDDDTISISSMDLNNNDIYNDDAICRSEKIYHETDKYDSQYVIGLPVFVPLDKQYILSVSVSTSSFYKYEIPYVMDYLYINSSIQENRVQSNYNGITDTVLYKIDILKIYLGRYSEYYVVIKTFWLRIVQRTWKRVFKKKQTQMKSLQRTIIEALRNDNKAIISTIKMEIENMASLKGMIKK